jgi:hypothetical protein
MKTLFVELFSGSGTVAKYAARVGFDEIITVDIDPQTCPTMVLDLLVETHRAQLIEKIQRLKHDGHRVAVHMSPPCQEFSPLQRIHKNKAGSAARRFDALMLVESGLAIADKVAECWTLENPGRGDLFATNTSSPSGSKLAELRERLHEHHVILDYCRYGGPMQKRTGIAFSDADLKLVFGDGKLCAGGECDSMFVDRVRGKGRVHMSIENISDYDERSSVPDQLALKLASSMMEFLHEQEVNKLVDFRKLREDEYEFKTKDGRWLSIPVNEAIFRPWDLPTSLEKLKDVQLDADQYAIVRVIKAPRKANRVIVTWRDFEPSEHDLNQYKDWLE